MACDAVSRLPGARLTIKLHPRASNAEVFREALRRRPELRAQIVRRGSVARWVSLADCVLSCASSSGIEAAALGAAVIHLWPEGAADLVPAAEWGFVGTASSAQDLNRLLAIALSGNWSPNEKRARQVFALAGAAAAGRVADEILPHEGEPAAAGKENPCSRVPHPVAMNLHTGAAT
jgi:hypothetical protein